MKKLLLLFVSILTLTSCNKDDDSDGMTDPVNVTTDDLIGEWTMTDFELNAISSTSFDGQTITQPSTSTGQNIDVSLTLSDNPNEFIFEGSLDVLLEFTNPFGQDVSQIIPTEAESGLGTGEWTLDGDMIIFDNGTSFLVQSIDSNNLTLIEIKETITSVEGFSVTIDSETTLIFTK